METSHEPLHFEEPGQCGPCCAGTAKRAGTRGMRAAASLFFLCFLPGALLHANAWALWSSQSGYAPATPPLPPVATAANLLAACGLYGAARIVEALRARTPP